MVESTCVVLLMLALMPLCQSWIFQKKGVTECSGQPYDNNTHICCHDTLHARFKFRSECCGSAVINPARTICCRRYSIWGVTDERIVENTKLVNPSTVCLHIWDTPSSPELS